MFSVTAPTAKRDIYRGGLVGLNLNPALHVSAEPGRFRRQIIYPDWQAYDSVCAGTCAHRIESGVGGSVNHLDRNLRDR